MNDEKQLVLNNTFAKHQKSEGNHTTTAGIIDVIAYYVAWKADIDAGVIVKVASENKRKHDEKQQAHTSYEIYRRCVHHSETAMELILLKQVHSSP